MIKRKEKIFGNVKFIGDLFLVKVLPFKAIKICTASLINKYINEQNVDIKDELMEGLILLINQIGPKLDSNKKSNGEDAYI